MLVGVTSWSASPAIFPFFMVGVENSDLGDMTADLGDRTADLGDWAEAPDFGERPAAEAEWSAELAGDRRRSSAFWPVSPVTWVKLLVLDSTSSVVVLAPNPPDGDASLLQKPPREKQHRALNKKGLKACETWVWSRTRPTAAVFFFF